MDLSARVEREFLPFVLKPARYLGNEYNAVRKKLSEVDLRVALCYPALYEKGMTDLNFEILYYVLNNRPSVWAERFFAPSQDAVEVLKEKSLPLFSLESKTALNLFDAVIFTLRSELQYIDLLNMLNLGGISSRSKSRSEPFPMIIAAASFKWNPEPIADLLDVALLGNWHGGLLPLIELAANAKKDRLSKSKALNQLSQLEGAYIPYYYRAEYNSFGEFSGLTKTEIPVPAGAKRIPSDPQKSYSVNLLFPLIRTGMTNEERCEAGRLISGNEHNGNAGDLELSLQVQIWKKNSPETSVLLMAEGTTELIWKNVKEKAFLSDQELQFRFPAFELENSELVDLQRIRKDEEIRISCGAGSLRLRGVIDRLYRDEDLLRLISFFVRQEFSKICLGFMVGLPTEKDEDITHLTDLVKRCTEIVSGVKEFQLSFQIFPFIPQPFTILQWEAMETRQKLQARYEAIQQGLDEGGIVLRFEDIQKSMLTAISKRSGRSFIDVIESAWSLGATSQFGESDYAAWDKAIEKTKLTHSKMLQPISTTVPLPWDHFDYGISKYDLKNRHLKALQGPMISTAGDYVGLGSGMPRERFNSLVKNAEFKAMVEKEHPQSEDDGEGSETIQYGRKVRRQVIPKAAIKKRVRIQYAKTGLARFISHLDVGRVFEIAARRASISLVYAQGKSPHPRFSFGPPLPVGIASGAEYIDVDVEIGDESDIQTGLNSCFPEGIEIVQYKILFAKVPALAAVINLADYQVDVSGMNLSRQLISNWMDSTEIWVDYPVKEEMQKLNIRPFVAEMELDNSMLKIRTTSHDGKMIRINEVLESLYIPGGIVSHLIRRVGQYIQNDAGIFTPFDII